MAKSNHNKPCDLLRNLISSVAESPYELAYITTISGELVYANRKARLHFALDEHSEKKLKPAETNIFTLNPELTQSVWDNAISAALAKGNWTLRINSNTEPSVALEINLVPHTLADETVFVCTNLHNGPVNWSEQLLELLAEATSPHTGETFFKTLMRNMATALQVKRAFITECLDQPPTKVRILAYWSDQGFLAPKEYYLKGTPCDVTIKSANLVLYKNNLGDLYPKKKGIVESYLGVPIFNADQSRVIGHIAFWDDQPMQDQGLTRAAFDVFTSRASAELQRVQAERKLRSSEKHYRLLVENQTDLILKLDSQQHIQFASPSFYKHFDSTADNSDDDKPFIKYFPVEKYKAINHCLKSVMENSEPINIECCVDTKQGWCWFIWTFKAMHDTPGGKDSNTDQIIVVGRDISKRRKAEERDQNHMQQLAHIGRVHSMGEVTAGIAHELNQSLTVIMSFANALQRILLAKNEHDPEVVDALERIIANTDRAGKIIRRMRNFVKKGDSNKVDTNINIVIRDVSKLMNIELRNAQVQLNQQLQSNLPRIRTDPIQIQQVLVNLIRNAIEVLEYNPFTQRNILIASQQTTNNHIEVSIKDNGPGLSPQIEATLFDAFVTSKPEGLGIGLSICQSIIQAHDGEIRGFNQNQSSNQNSGTTFLFTLPIISGEKQP